VKVTKRRTKKDFADFVTDTLLSAYPEAKKLIIVMRISLGKNLIK
jgi:hypothetical protein